MRISQTRLQQDPNEVQRAVPLSKLFVSTKDSKHLSRSGPSAAELNVSRHETQDSDLDVREEAEVGAGHVELNNRTSEQRKCQYASPSQPRKLGSNVRR